MVSTLVPMLLFKAVLAGVHEAAIESQAKAHRGNIATVFPSETSSNDQIISSSREGPAAGHQSQDLKPRGIAFLSYGNRIRASTFPALLPEKIATRELQLNALTSSKQLYRRALATVNSPAAFLSVVMKRGQTVAPVRDLGHTGGDIELGPGQQPSERQDEQSIKSAGHSEHTSHPKSTHRPNSQLSFSDPQQKTATPEHTGDVQESTSTRKVCCYALSQRQQTRKTLGTKYNWNELKEGFKEKYRSCILDCFALTFGLEIVISLIASQYIQQYVNHNFDLNTDLQSAFFTFILALLGLTNHMVEGSNARRIKYLQDSMQDETLGIIQESFDRIERCEEKIEIGFKGVESKRGKCEEMHRGIEGLAQALKIERRVVRKGLREVVRETRRCKAARKMMEDTVRQAGIDCKNVRAKAEELTEEIRKCQATRKAREDGVGSLTAKQKRKLRKLYRKNV